MLRELNSGPTRFPWVPAALAGLTLVWLPMGRELVRDPMSLTGGAGLASLMGLFVFFAIARQICGAAPAIFAAGLLAVSAPWMEAAQTAPRLMIGEVLVLIGAAWMIREAARHREVPYTWRSIGRIAFAGLFFGVAATVSPATFATFLATLTVWLFLGLRRSSFSMHPMEGRRHTIVPAVLGTVSLYAVTVLAAWGATVALGEGGSFRPVPVMPEGYAMGWDLLQTVYRSVLSPGTTTDGLVVMGLAVVVAIRLVERLRGQSWADGGLLPWAFMILYVAALGASEPPTTGIPFCVPPLFILGLGWLLLRGLAPGRIRRQEYVFVLVWLLMCIAFLPGIPKGGSGTRALAASLTVLPGAMLVLGRGSRALWETGGTPVARAGILAFVSLPILAAVAGALKPYPALTQPTTWLPVALIVAASLGALSALIRVRPDAPRIRPLPQGEGRHSSGRSRGRRGARGGRGNRGARGGRGGRERRDRGSRGSRDRRGENQRG
ncbi:MAG: hypothetical protein QF819_07170 [Gemmatimonadota bacterium]|jgi:hypothetical protein|nr:hypothetical protein [Gemmatimonadota bacterium]MDP6802940.1 hypothetical protein [Gemmatimonadota bacterium]